MKRLLLKDILKAINGRIIQGNSNRSIEHVTRSSDKIRTNTLYFNINKKRNKDLKLKDQRAIIVTKDPSKLAKMKKITIIKVHDVNRAYWKFIRYYRSLFKIPILFVTGTCGKTSTKEMIKHILSKYYNIQATYKSNNDIKYNFGYLMGIDDKTQAAVFETGVEYPGDLKRYTKYFQPHTGIITTIGVDHLKDCKTLENYIKEKAAMLDVLQNKGTLILNADDDNIKKINLNNYKGKIVYFGFNDNAHLRAVDVKYSVGGMKFTVLYQEDGHDLRIPAFIPGYGEHNVYNALAAIAGANNLAMDKGISIQKAVERLKTFKPVERHLEVCKGIKGSTVIDDTWSTNPTSIEAALKVLTSLSTGNKTIAVLGKMSLLGDALSKWNAVVAEKIMESGVDILVTIGDGAKEIGEVAIRKGMNSNNVHLCKDAKEVYEVLKRNLDHNTIVLVKTSMLEKHGNLMKLIKV